MKGTVEQLEGLSSTTPLPAKVDKDEPDTIAVSMSGMEQSPGAGRKDCGAACGVNEREETPSCSGRALDQ